MFRRETPCVKKFRKMDMRIMETETENRMKEGKKKKHKKCHGLHGPRLFYCTSVRYSS